MCGRGLRVCQSEMGHSVAPCLSVAGGSGNVMPVWHGGRSRVVIHREGVDGSVPHTLYYAGIGDKMALVALCCLHKSWVPVAMELPFVKCPVSVQSGLGTESLRKKSPPHHITWEQKSPSHVLF